MTENYPVGVLRVGTDVAASERARETLALALPNVPLRDFVATQGRHAGAGEVALVCEPTQQGALDALRLLRASGFTGGVVLLATIDPDASELARYAPARAVHPAGLVDELPTAVCELAGAGDDHPARQALQRTRRLVAAGEIAAGLQHAINNPLTALLAEAQLLELEELPDDHREAIGRIVTQTRRVIELVRKLDGVSERKPG